MLCQSAFDGRDAAGGFSGFGAAPNDMKMLAPAEGLITGKAC